MKELATFEFTPDLQPLESPVSFKLRPLDMRGFYEIQKAIRDGGGDVPTWEGVETASRYVKGWSGPIGEFSRKRVTEILEGDADANWVLWWFQITAALYRNALLKDDAAKKS